MIGGDGSRVGGAAGGAAGVTCLLIDSITALAAALIDASSSARICARLRTGGVDLLDNTGLELAGDSADTGGTLAGILAAGVTTCAGGGLLTAGELLMAGV